MGRHDLDPEDRDREPLQLAQILTCETCLIDFDHVFTAPEGIFDSEDIVDPIREEVTCPNGHAHTYTYEGWLHHEDAG